MARGGGRGGGAHCGFEHDIRTFMFRVALFRRVQLHWTLGRNKANSIQQLLKCWGWGRGGYEGLLVGPKGGCLSKPAKHSLHLDHFCTYGMRP